MRHWQTPEIIYDTNATQIFMVGTLLDDLCIGHNNTEALSWGISACRQDEKGTTKRQFQSRRH